MKLADEWPRMLPEGRRRVENLLRVGCECRGSATFGRGGVALGRLVRLAAGRQNKLQCLTCDSTSFGDALPISTTRIGKAIRCATMRWLRPMTSTPHEG
jgi:hypothetical protein